MYLCSRLATALSKSMTSSTTVSPSPIHKLPVEILVLVFEAYCDSWTPNDHSIPPQLVIAQVCRHWRSITLDLPTLWTKVTITSQTPSHIVSTYLQRSQQLPLDLEIDLRYDAADAAQREQVLMAWKSVKSSAMRWRRLVLQIGPHDATAVAEDLRELGTPLLEELRISSASHVSGITSIFEGGAPKLKSLTLIGISLERFSPSLHQLTSLNLTSNCPMQFSTFQCLTRNMVNLQELTLRSRVVEGWPVYPSEEDTISLPSLTTLKLSDRRWPLFIPLLSISAPNLHTLSLYELVAHDLPETFMESHLCNNFPSIRSLIVKGKSSFIDNGCFSQLSRIFPSIDHFALLGVDELFVRESTRSLHEPCIWPKLTTISMTPVTAEDMICSLISARTKPTTNHLPLKTLAIPIPTQLKRTDWMSQQLSIQECRDPSSFSVSYLASESTFTEHQFSKSSADGNRFVFPLA